MGNVMLTPRRKGDMPNDSSEPPTCFSCTLQLTETIHVKCNECPVSVCMLCFQCGAESSPHKRGHNYELVKPYEDGDGMTWTHQDEFELLKAAHKFKMGNWGEIAESIGRGRRDGQHCKDYFEKHFVRGWIGQYSIKKAHWEKTKYEMSINQTLDSVLQKSCLESTERMLLIADAYRDSGENLDVHDAKLGAKVQQILEKYIQKCIDNEIEIKYERPQALKGQYHTVLEVDPLDPDDKKSRKSVTLEVKMEVGSDVSDNEETPEPSSSTRRNGPPSPKKKKTTRVIRESSTDSEKTPSDNERLERDTEDEDQAASEFETCPEFSEDEQDKKPKKGAATPSTRRRKRKRLMMSKKERRLSEFRKKMNREQNMVENKLKMATLRGICSSDEVKLLRQDFPRLIHENGVSKSDRPKIRQSTELNLLGYNIEREEFETEWFNEAEQLISRLTISAAPPQVDERLDWENDIKFARLRHYIRLLGIRKAKRNTVLEHDKINEFIRWYKEACLLSKNKSMSEMMDSRTEKEKLLAMTQQFLKRDEYQALRAILEKIDAMTERIEVLQDLQRNGETSLRNAPVERKTKKKMRKIDCEHQKKIHMEWNKFKKWHTDGWK
ncbi:hypothetical protein L5515_013864 [Caenorhabditis briggsae]|uniref:Protein CBR-ADA-2 n=3 Tax=Caenorhabditis briggsae TaxID=6238 RepID=A0AAE9EDP3_CAEBR|nr:hypothetical protein L5515_013864 [Caenorhabditis briggsae]